jgi:hypothetical protein
MFRSATEESLRRLKVFEERSSSTGGASCDSRTVHQNRSGSTEGALEEFEARIRALERLSGREEVIDGQRPGPGWWWR